MNDQKVITTSYDPKRMAYTHTLISDGSKMTEAEVVKFLRNKHVSLPEIKRVIDLACRKALTKALIPAVSFVNRQYEFLLSNGQVTKDIRDIERLLHRHNVSLHTAEIIIRELREDAYKEYLESKNNPSYGYHYFI